MTTENQQRSASFGSVNEPELRQRRAQQATDKTTRNVQEAVILAAEAIGEDGRGRSGLVGYLKNAALEEPKAYLPLLGKILAMRNPVVDHPVRIVKMNSTLEEKRALFRAEMSDIRAGRPSTLVFEREGYGEQE